MNLDQLQAVAEAATPGPWAARDSIDGFGVQFDGDEVANLCECVVAPPSDGRLSHPRMDATHIATFDPPTVLALIAVAKAATVILAHIDEGVTPDAVSVEKLRAALEAK